jgi:hypothetical protein
MRINLDWITPEMHGRPLRSWAWHAWSDRRGPIRGRWSGGFTLLGLRAMLTFDAYWSGFSVSVNLWNSRKRGA